MKGAAEHMLFEVSRMSNEVFSSFSHLDAMGSMVGFGETDDFQPHSEDPFESFVVDLLLSDRPNEQNISLVVQKHVRKAPPVTVMAVWNRKFL